MCAQLRPHFLDSQISASASASRACSSSQRLTDLEDIGDGNGVLGGLALGGDDGDGRPGHGGCRGLPVVSIEQSSLRRRRGYSVWAQRP